MIYFNNQLMPNDVLKKLFIVTNSVPFDSYEDHEAALYIHIHELVETAMSQGENPIVLIEDYLDVSYLDSDSIDEIASFLIETDKMQTVLWTLRDKWHNMNQNLTEDSLMMGSSVSKDDAVQLYSEITLRSYLETLSTYTND